MSKLLSFVFACSLAAMVASPALACHRGGCGGGCDNCCQTGCCQTTCCQPVCCQPQITWQERTITCYRPEWREREVSCTINRVVSHTVTEQRSCTVCVPTWHNEKRTITVCKCVPRQIQRQVCCTRMVPVCVTDPCTGCSHTCCKPECYTQTITCTVMEQVPENREIQVPVCVMKQEQRPYTVQRCVFECKPEVVKHMERYCVSVPYQQKIKVAVCQPCCQSSCCGGCGGCY